MQHLVAQLQHAMLRASMRHPPRPSRNPFASHTAVHQACGTAASPSAPYFVLGLMIRLVSPARSYHSQAAGQLTRLLQTSPFSWIPATLWPSLTVTLAAARPYQAAALAALKSASAPVPHPTVVASDPAVLTAALDIVLPRSTLTTPRERAVRDIGDLLLTAQATAGTSHAMTYSLIGAALSKQPYYHELKQQGNLLAAADLFSVVLGPSGDKLVALDTTALLLAAQRQLAASGSRASLQAAGAAAAATPGACGEQPLGAARPQGPAALGCATVASDGDAAWPSLTHAGDTGASTLIAGNAYQALLRTALDVVLPPGTLTIPTDQILRCTAALLLSLPAAVEGKGGASHAMQLSLIGSALREQLSYKRGSSRTLKGMITSSQLFRLQKLVGRSGDDQILLDAAALVRAAGQEAAARNAPAIEALPHVNQPQLEGGVPAGTLQAAELCPVSAGVTASRAASAAEAIVRPPLPEQAQAGAVTQAAALCTASSGLGELSGTGSVQVPDGQRPEVKGRRRRLFAPHPGGAEAQAQQEGVGCRSAEPMMPGNGNNDEEVRDVNTAAELGGLTEGGACDSLLSSISGVRSLDVRQRRLEAVTQADVQWLMGEGKKGAGQTVLGFDTKLCDDSLGTKRLSLIQLGNADRVLLIQVPVGLGTDRLAVPQPLADLLSSPSIFKVATDAWRDALLVHRNVGVAMDGVVCLTKGRFQSRTRRRSDPCLAKEVQSLAEQLPLGLSTITKDQGGPTSERYATALTDAQAHEAALYAFASWRVAAGNHIRLQNAPRMNLSRVSQQELALLCDIVSMSNILGGGDGGDEDRMNHEFSDVVFTDEDTLIVRMHRFSTRMRRTAQQVEVYANDPAATVCRAEATSVKGKRLKLQPLRGETFFAHREHGVKTICSAGEFDQDRALKAAMYQILLRKVSLADCSALMMLSGQIPEAPVDSRPASELDSHRARVRQLCSSAGLNASQAEAVEATLLPKHKMQLIQGPPGTGKTHVIREAAAIWCSNPDLEPPAPEQQGEPLMVCCTRSNVAAMNIARALIRNPMVSDKFRIVVSNEFHFEWHEHMYQSLEEHLITSNKLTSPTLGRDLQKSMKVLVCTLSMLCSPKLHENLLHNRCVTRLLVDEASQAYVGDYLPHLVQLKDTVRSMTFFGDDKQLPPYGSNTAHISSVFDSHHIWQPQAEHNRSQGIIPSVMLDVSYRLQPNVCDFVSRHMYGGKLRPSKTEVQEPFNNWYEMAWMDVDGREESQGTSTMNVREAEAVRDVAHRLHSTGHHHWKVLSMYDAQRQEIERQLRSQPDLPWEDRAYNVDTFQGREEDIIIVSLARTSGLGFLRDDRRVNVMLTRSTKWMLIVGNLKLALRHPQTLIGKLAKLCGEKDLVL